MRGPDKKYIHRMESGYTHGWYVKIPQSRSGNGNRIRKYFGDAKYGGEQEAFEAARRYRDAVLEERGMSDLAFIKIPRKRESSARNTSGVMGLRKKRERSPDGEYWIWCAYGMRNGVEWEVCFGTKKRTEQEAFQLACRERFERHGTLRVVDPAKLPAMPEVPYIIDP